MNERPLKRVSLLVGEDQYDKITQKQLNLSWLMRDLLDDYFGQSKISIEVGPETYALYQKIVSGSGQLSREFEPYFRDALHLFLKSRIEEMQKLEKNAFKPPVEKKR